MRGLLSLTLMVFVLIESTKEEKESLFGLKTATSGGGFNSTNNTTINSTMATELPTVGTKVVADGVREAIKNNLGFRPQPANGEDTKIPQGHTAPTQTQKSRIDLSSVILLENENGFRPKPTDGNVDQEKQK